MPDQVQVTPAGQLVRSQAGGCFRLSLPTEATSHHCHPGCPPSCRRGRRYPGALFVDTSRGSYFTGGRPA